MNQGWMRVREAAILLGVSTSTVRRRIDAGDLKGRTGESGRREVFIPKKLRDQHAEQMNHDAVPAHALRGKGIGHQSMQPSEPDAEASSPARGDEEQDDSASADDTIRRYERLAGGSLMLAEQRSKELQAHVDHAYEQLAHTRSQVRRCRKVAYAGWGGFAVAVVLGLALTITMSLSISKVNTKLAAQEQATRQAQRQHQDVVDRISRIKSAAAAVENQVKRSRPASLTESAAVDTEH